MYKALNLLIVLKAHFGELFAF